MRSPIRKSLISTFRQEFEKRYPKFSPHELPRGSPDVWEWRSFPNCVFFIMLCPFEDEDSYVIEAAWSEDGVFPWSSIGTTMNPNNSSWRGRLATTAGNEKVWELAPEVGLERKERMQALERGETVAYPPPPSIEAILPRIPSCVEDALGKIQQQALLLFEQVTEIKGQSGQQY